MTARRNYTFTNKYIPTATKTDSISYKRDLNTWLNELKFKEVSDNLDQYFSNVKRVSFDIIYNDIRMSQFQKPLEEYQTIHKIDFNRYNQKFKDEMLSEAYRSERKMAFFEKDLNRKHFFEKYPYVELSAMKKDLEKKSINGPM